MVTFVLLAIFGVVIPLIIFFVLIVRYQQRERMRSEHLDSQLGIFAADLEKLAAANGKVVGKLAREGRGATDIAALWGDSPECEVVVEDVCSARGVYAGWDYCVILHEATEQYLGSELFAGLEFRFADIPGVEICRQEDRELFLIRGKTLDPESLRDEVWRKFLEAAAEKRKRQ